MDASCKIQESIHVLLCLIHKSMCPGFWVHIKLKFVRQPLCLAVYIIQNHCQRQHMHRIKSIAQILEGLAVVALPSAV